MENRRQIGIISASSVDDYANGHIKKHEKTRAKKEKDRTELTETQNANEGPVFLTYKADISVENILSAIVAKSSSIDVTTDDHIRHEL